MVNRSFYYIIPGALPPRPFRLGDYGIFCPEDPGFCRGDSLIVGETRDVVYPMARIGRHRT